VLLTRLGRSVAPGLNWLVPGRGEGFGLKQKAIVASRICRFVSNDFLCRLSYEDAAEKLRMIYDEIDLSWSDFLVRCDEEWSHDARPEKQSVSSIQRLRHASDERVAERGVKIAERKAAPKRISVPKKQSAVQIMNHSLSLTKDKTKCLRGPWYAHHWHLFAPFLPEDLRSRSSRLAVQLTGEKSTGEVSGARGDDYSRHADLAAEKAATIVQPRTIVNGTMFPYQLEGLQWMVRQHSFGVGGILGDEMGLGKTLQVIVQCENRNS
jgi:hypothetical protein